ncbi:DNA adenine methylase [Leptospira santarosai]|uniref:DNA adenine methylase n=1 Tax=Leptospira santarosai TaxID=28183 RepID=UPI0002BDD4E5|nr:DNA adenine methylase [Leptospira santarosai]EMO12463.1 D12 class N6 adenine-specific DNA methyltransferase [Leptospira santarosai str. CBC523]MDI7183642.1 DNA adenine methylase [Leptospira santarosai]
MSINRPVLKYNGGKFLLAPWITSFFPEHDTFVDGFGGAANVLLQKSRSRVEYYFDLDSEVTNFMQILGRRDSAKELIRRIRWTPYAREVFEMSISNPLEDPIDRALQFCAKCWMNMGQNRSSSGSFRTHGNLDKSGGYIPARLWTDLSPYYQAATRLRGVVIENRSFLEVASGLDRPNTLFFLDPPYLGSVRGSGDLYTHEMKSAIEHESLLNLILSLNGMVIICGYPSDLYASKLESQGWKKVTRETRDNKRRERIEALWLNPLVQQRLAEREPELFEVGV